MKRMFRKYKAFMKTGAMNVFAYKFNIYSWLMVMASSLLCMFFLWKSVFENATSDVINGFTFKEMIAYLVIINIFAFTMGGGETSHTITDEIQKGQIATSLIKPISYRLRFVFSTLGSLIACNLIVGIPVMAIATIVMVKADFFVISSVPRFLLNVVFFLVAQVLAQLLVDVIDYIFGLISFYTMASFGLSQIKEVLINFLSGILIPIAFFPGWAAKILNVLPFVHMAQNPALIYLGKMSVPAMINTVICQIVWLIILEVFAHFFFERAIKIVTIQGG